MLLPLFFAFCTSITWFGCLEFKHLVYRESTWGRKPMFCWDWGLEVAFSLEAEDVIFVVATFAGWQKLLQFRSQNLLTLLCLERTWRRKPFFCQRQLEVAVGDVLFALVWQLLLHGRSSCNLDLKICILFHSRAGCLRRNIMHTTLFLNNVFFCYGWGSNGWGEISYSCFPCSY